VQLGRIALGTRDELAVCRPEDVARVARELGISQGEIEAAAIQGPGTAVLLQRMLIALGVDPAAPALQDPTVIGELRRLCASCGQKSRCERDLADGTAPENFHTYCPNSMALDSIYVETVFQRT
jgi:hypothetical protein